jgi:hypothetical protein
MPLKQIHHMLAKRRIDRVKRAPVVIGATGGSGTRVIHGVLEKAGLFMGAKAKLNHAGDAMDVEPMLDAFINPILSATNSLDYVASALPTALATAALRDLALGVDRFLRDMPNGDMPWGWKNPRSMYVLPLIRELFSDIRFIHLIRDGRDMATSDNQNQPRKHFEALFGHALEESDPLGSIQLWAAANLAIANWGERHLGSQYLCVRFEDLCANPVAGVTRILNFAGFEEIADQSIRDIAEEFVTPPASLGRWRALDASVATALAARGADALSHFGYSDELPVKLADGDIPSS